MVVFCVVLVAGANCSVVVVVDDAAGAAISVDDDSVFISSQIAGLQDSIDSTLNTENAANTAMRVTLDIREPPDETPTGRTLLEPAALVNPKEISLLKLPLRAAGHT